MPEQDDREDGELDDDLFAAEQVFLGSAVHEPGTHLGVFGLGVVMLDCGAWRVYESVDALDAAYEDDDQSGYLDTIDPTRFASAAQISDYLRAHAARLETDDEEEEPAQPTTERSPGVH